MGPRGRKVSEKQITTDWPFREYLRNLGVRAGYAAELTPYAFRRGNGNMMDGNPTVTTAERRQRMAHKNDDTFGAYISRQSVVDAQAVMFEEPQERALFHQLRTVAAMQDFTAPGTAGSGTSAFSRRRDRGALRQARREHFSDGMHQLEEEGLAAQNKVLTDFVPFERPKPSPKASAIVVIEISRQSIAAMILSRIQPFVDMARPVRPVFRYSEAEPTKDKMCPSCPTLGETKSTILAFNLHLLECLMKERQRVMLEDLKLQFTRRCGSKTIFGVCNHELPVHTQNELDKSLKHVSAHVNNLVAISGTFSCTWSSCTEGFRDLDSLRKHMHHRHGATTLEMAPMISYCFEHRIYFRNLQDWRGHCLEHIETMKHNPSPFFGIIYRHQVIACAGICPYCLADESLGAEDRCQQYSSTRLFRSHLERHMMTSQDYPTKCPCTDCKQELHNRNACWTHLWDAHGVTIKRFDPDNSDGSAEEADESSL
ncbi:hypothetical protein KVT40_004023 [Elsinoe batatas]|uniref:C2H2-type domain-containing protein n=1 Tax=Elsinoe batatas TaxID=2601811 RepID=A0A8K0L635_9PEZI|nr:hypothetical protein KVT40_004023 [Elsinoe batatas]